MLLAQQAILVNIDEARFRSRIRNNRERMACEEVKRVKVATPW